MQKGYQYQYHDPCVVCFTRYFHFTQYTDSETFGLVYVLCDYVLFIVVMKSHVAKIFEVHTKSISGLCAMLWWRAFPPYQSIIDVLDVIVAKSG